MVGYKGSIKLAMRDELLGRFQTAGVQEGDILSPEWLHHEYLPSLTAKEERIFEEVIGEMITEGLIEYCGGVKPTYRLTKKGLLFLVSR